MKHNFLMGVFLLSLLYNSNLSSQISIVNIPVQAFNLTPDALMNVNILNNEEEKQVQLITQVFNSHNSLLVTIRSESFLLRKGMNSGMNSGRRVASAEYASQSAAVYLKTTHNLPSGRYKLCCSIIILNDAGEPAMLCEEIEADFNQYLYLVTPFDGDTVETKYPLLSWNHSEPFSILNQGESYRMIVTELKSGESPEEAVTVNTPVMIKNYLKEHQLQYPPDAKDLKNGSRYAWQVQKISDGVVINKTEAWVFNLRKDPELKNQKYVVPKRQLDGSYYQATDGMVYFKFSEEYKSQGKLGFQLTDSKSQAVEVDLRKDNTIDNNALTELKISGDNLYELSLNTKKLSSGFYTLRIRNEKNESFYLKIFLP